MSDVEDEAEEYQDNYDEEDDEEDFGDGEQHRVDDNDDETTAAPKPEFGSAMKEKGKEREAHARPAAAQDKGTSEGAVQTTARIQAGPPRPQLTSPSAPRPAPALSAPNNFFQVVPASASEWSVEFTEAKRLTQTPPAGAMLDLHLGPEVYLSNLLGGLY